MGSFNRAAVRRVSRALLDRAGDDWLETVCREMDPTEATVMRVLVGAAGGPGAGCKASELVFAFRTAVELAGAHRAEPLTVAAAERLLTALVGDDPVMAPLARRVVRALEASS